MEDGKDEGIQGEVPIPPKVDNDRKVEPPVADPVQNPPVGPDLLRQILERKAAWRKIYFERLDNDPTLTYDPELDHRTDILFKPLSDEPGEVGDPPR